MNHMTTPLRRRFRPLFRQGFFRAAFKPPALTLVALMTAVGASARADVKLASYFGDHMVLQRDREVCLWGTGDTNTSVTVSLRSQSLSTTVGTDSRWQLQLKPMPAGGPFELKVASGSSSVTVKDVLVGDVWLCSGQSNMQMPVKDCAAVEQNTANLELPQVRLCSVGKSSNLKIQTAANIKWRTSTPESAKNFSAVGYFFASELAKDPALAKVPIGVIDSSFGGTMCEGWIPQAALAQFDPKDLRDSMFNMKPATLYNAMIAPLGNSPLKGVVWYQGESNSGHPELYPRLLGTMIAEWRKQFATPNLPFFIVQLPDYAMQWDGFYWPWEREAQAKTVQATPHTALVVAINTTDGYNLHPHEKLEIGRRTALLARRDAYHESIVAQGPVFKTAKGEGSAIRLSFDTRGYGLANSSTGGIRGFAVAGEDGQYRIAEAKIDGDSVVVQSELVPAPEFVRYAWAGVPNSTLINKSGLPAAPFRTDSLPYNNVEVQKEPISRQVTTSAYKIAINGDGMITSLSVRGAQFISNAPGMAGGSSLPFGFGARSLANIQELNSDLLSCRDNDVTLQFKFGEADMEWTLTNRNKDDAKFNLALALPVTVARTNDLEPVTLSCKKSTLTISGVDAITDSENGKVLHLVVKKGASKSLVLKVSEK